MRDLITYIALGLLLMAGVFFVFGGLGAWSWYLHGSKLGQDIAIAGAALLLPSMIIGGGLLFWLCAQDAAKDQYAKHQRAVNRNMREWLNQPETEERQR